MLRVDVDHDVLGGGGKPAPLAGPRARTATGGVDARSPPGTDRWPSPMMP